MTAAGGERSKINLLLLSNTLDLGGVEEVIRTYATYFDKERYSVAVICFVAGTISAEIARIPGVQLLHITATDWKARFRQIYAFAKSFKPDIVHNHTGWYGLLIGKLLGARTVETVHNVYFWFGRPQRLQYGLFAHLSDRVIAVSGVVKEFTIDFFPFFPKGRIQVVHNGIEVHPPPAEEVRRSTRAEFGVAEDAVLLGFVGRLTEQKGLTYLLDAMKEILPDYPTTKILLIGEGELREELAAKAERLSVLHAVIFGGTRRDIARILSAFDIFVLPSLWEGLPISLLEAMAMELPVVATDAGGVKEVIDSGKVGVLLQPKDVAGLVKSLSHLIADGAARRSMGIAARQKIIEGFSAQAMLAKTEQIYREILARK
jgi:glycosyltransferase involved in cell wall biosynthesis